MICPSCGAEGTLTKDGTKIYYKRSKNGDGVQITEIKKQRWACKSCKIHTVQVNGAKAEAKKGLDAKTGLYHHICLRCRHEWDSKVEHPKACGKCKNHYWDTPKKEPKHKEKVAS